jgi:hypothetical protein
MTKYQQEAMPEIFAYCKLLQGVDSVAASSKSISQPLGRSYSQPSCPVCHHVRACSVIPNTHGLDEIGKN